VVVTAICSSIALGAVTIHAPTSARVGAHIVVSATGIKPGHYTVLIERVAEPTSCLAAIGSANSLRGKLTVSGPVPARLSCHLGQNTSFGTVHVTSGSYLLVVGELIPPAGFNQNASFAKTRIKLVA
jgi:hypothetical protein